MRERSPQRRQQIDSHPLQMVAGLSERHFAEEACLGGRIGAVQSVTCLKASAGVRGIQMYVHVVQELESRISQRSRMYLYPTMSSTASH
jgi:hypothetical protein